MANAGRIGTDTIEQYLAILVGQRLTSSRNFYATRHFYFGQGGPEEKGLYTLGVECAWRIQEHSVIIVGSEDYYERAGDNRDESWEPGTPTGHLQNQKLGQLFGGISGDRALNAGSGLVVESVREEPCHGIRIELSGSFTLELFPASAGEMEWIFMAPHGSLVLMNGAVTKTTKEDEGPSGQKN